MGLRVRRRATDGTGEPPFTDDHLLLVDLNGASEVQALDAETGEDGVGNHLPGTVLR